jgi:hypothetical protein
MDPALATIIVAVITTFGFSIKEFKSMKKNNSLDHGQVMKRLDRVQDSVDHVAERLDDHVDWHLKK